MKEAAMFGDLTVKIERYRYNLIASTSWVLFGMLFGGAVMLFNGVTLLIGYNPLYLAACLISAGIAGAFVFRSMLRLTPKDRETKKMWRTGLILLVLPFFVTYDIIPRILTLSQLQQSLYYSLVWYPSLGFGLILLGVSAELRDKLLTTRTITLSGIAISASSAIFIPLSGLVTSCSGVMALNMIAGSMMMLIYFGSFLVSFFRATKAFTSHEAL